jgi:hypothetical protein
MHIHSFRHLTTVAALALTSIAAAAACSSTPGQAPSATTPSTATPGTATPSSATPSTGAPRAPNPQSCLGAVTYTIDASEGGPPWPALCIAVGGVLRVENLGPDGFSVSPADKVS